MLVAVFLMYTGPSTVVVLNRTGVPLHDLELTVSQHYGGQYGEQRTAVLATGDSLRLVVGGREESTLHFAATDPEGRSIRDSSYIYLDDRTYDRFEVINGRLDAEYFYPGDATEQIGGAVRLEMGRGDTVYDATASLRDTANGMLSPVLRLPRLLPGDTVMLAPREYKGFATLAVAGSMNHVREFSDTSRLRLGPGRLPRRATLKGMGWRPVERFSERP